THTHVLYVQVARPIKRKEIQFTFYFRFKKVKDQVKVGTDTTWIKRGGDGYVPFKAHYGFGFNDLKPMQISLVYDALKNNKLDVALGYTTDGKISAYDLVVLKDDKHFFSI